MTAEPDLEMRKAPDAATPEMTGKLDAVKCEMFDEGAQTRRAPQPAAWMHEAALGKP